MPGFPGRFELSPVTAYFDIETGKGIYGFRWDSAPLLFSSVTPTYERALASIRTIPWEDLRDKSVTLTGIVTMHSGVAQARCEKFHYWITVEAESAQWPLAWSADLDEVITGGASGDLYISNEAQVQHLQTPDSKAELSAVDLTRISNKQGEETRFSLIGTSTGVLYGLTLKSNEYQWKVLARSERDAPFVAVRARRDAIRSRVNWVGVTEALEIASGRHGERNLGRRELPRVPDVISCALAENADKLAVLHGTSQSRSVDVWSISFGHERD
jgi:hypothetical protein